MFMRGMSRCRSHCVTEKNTNFWIFIAWHAWMRATLPSQLPQPGFSMRSGSLRKPIADVESERAFSTLKYPKVSRAMVAGAPSTAPGPGAGGATAPTSTPAQ